MVDNLNPTNQFHPYQPPDATPHTERGSNVGDMLRKVGINPDQLGSMGDSMKNVDVRKSLDKARDYARRNPALVLGSIAAAVIGVGWLRGRR